MAMKWKWKLKAKQTFISAARSLVNSDQANAMLGTDTLYSPKCVGTGETVYITLATIPLDGGKSWDNQKSPYGVKYTAGASGGKLNTAPSSSYIAIKSTIEDGNCKLSYGIYLTDGIMMIKGGSGNASTKTAMKDSSNANTTAMVEENVEAANVVKKTS